MADIFDKIDIFDEVASQPTMAELNAKAKSPEFKTAREKFISEQGRGEVGGVPEWGRKSPGWYGAYGAAKALGNMAVEGAGMAGGAALGALTPIPGGTIAGTGAGYALAKRASAAIGLSDDEQDNSIGGIAKDIGTGAVMGAVGKYVAPVAKAVGKFIAPATTRLVSELPITQAFSKKGVATAIGDDPIDSTVRLLKNSTGLKVSDKKAIAETLLKHDVVGDIPNGNATNKLVDKIGALEDKAGEVISQYAGQDATISTQPIIQDLLSLKAKAMKSTDWKARVDAIDSMVKNIESNPNALNGQIPIADAQAMKVDLGKKAAWDAYSDFENLVRQTTNRGFAKQINTVAPEIAPINETLGPMYEALPQIARAESRIANLEPGMSLKQSALGSLGPVGKAAGAVLGTTSHPKIAPRIAQAKYNLQQKMVPGEPMPEITVPDFIPLPPKPETFFDPSTGMRTTNEAMKGMPQRIPTQSTQPPETFFDKTTGTKVNKHNFTKKEIEAELKRRGLKK